MTTRKKGEHIWLETPPDVQTATPLGEIPRNHRSAHYGLVVTCTNIHQGTYTVCNVEGAQWLVARGVDGVFDIIDKPLDSIAQAPHDNRIITAVKVYIKRNGRRQD